MNCRVASTDVRRCWLTDGDVARDFTAVVLSPLDAAPDAGLFLVSKQFSSSVCGHDGAGVVAAESLSLG